MLALTAFEQAVLDKLLAGDHPELATLRRQAASLLVTDRDYSPVGVNVYLSVPDLAPRTARSSFDLGDVAFQFQDADNPGHAVLMVGEGRLQELMVYNWTDVWPARPDLAVSWLKYLAPRAEGRGLDVVEQRDMRGLARELAA